MAMTSESLAQRIQQACVHHDFPSDVKLVFQDVLSDATAREFLATTKNVLQNSGNALLYDLLLEAYLKHEREFVPDIKFKMNKSLIEDYKPMLCLSFHSNFSPLALLLLSKERPVAVVSDYPNTIKRVARSTGLRKGSMDLISADSRCLANILKRLREGYSVISTIDFRNAMGKPFDQVSDSALRFACKVKPVTVGGINTVTDAGELVCVVRRLDPEAGLAQMKADLSQFVGRQKPRAQYQFSEYDYQQQRQMVADFESPRT